MFKKTITLAAATGLAIVLGTANAAPMELTTAQMDSVSAGSNDVPVTNGIANGDNGMGGYGGGKGYGRVCPGGKCGGGKGGKSRPFSFADAGAGSVALGHINYATAFTETLAAPGIAQAISFSTAQSGCGGCRGMGYGIKR